MELWRALKAHNRGVEVQNGAIKGLTMVKICFTFDPNPYQSEKSDPDPNQSEKKRGMRIRIQCFGSEPLTFSESFSIFSSSVV
jgi:hypothetical protein